MLADYGVPVPEMRIVESLDDALAAGRDVGYPVALKTAMPGIVHKTDVGGVHLNLSDGAALEKAYEHLCERLGPRTLLSKMAAGEVEMAFGVLSDRQFGPLVMVAGGGVFIEILEDRQVALAPMDTGSARRRIDALKMRRMLDGFRGSPACDVDALATALTRLSMLARDLGDLIKELDVNPVKVGADGCVVVDALVVPRSG